MPETASTSSGRAPLLAAVLGYAAIAIWWTYPLMGTARTQVALPARIERLGDLGRISRYDQLLTIRGVAYNANALLHGNLWGLIDNGLCYPAPLAGTLGEHMIEAGILGLPAYALSRDPVLAYNAACLLAIVIAGATMFSLVFYWTGSPAAAFVSGLLFAFHPSRVGNLAHLAVVGTHWIPLVLLGFERTLAGGRARDAILLATATCLQLVVGAYPLMTLVFFVLPYGAIRLIQRRSFLRLRHILALVAVVVVAAAVATAVIVPYQIEQSIWRPFVSRPTLLFAYHDLLPGGKEAAGMTMLLLALLLLIPRCRVILRQQTPVSAVLGGTILCLLVCAQGPLWPGGFQVPSLYPWLSKHIGVMRAVRAPGVVSQGVYLGLAILAGAGLARASARLPRPWSLALAVAVVVGALLEMFQPAIASLSYHGRETVLLRRVAPGRHTLDAYRAFDRNSYDGAILDLPYFEMLRGRYEAMARYTFLSGYHLRPTAACYNSFRPPSHNAVARITRRLPEDRAIRELAAVGLRNLVFHRTGANPSLLDELISHDGVRLLYRSTEASAFRIEQRVATHSDTGLLRFDGVRLPPVLGRPNMVNRTERAPKLVVTNLSASVWVSSRPLRPVPYRVRWTPSGEGTPGPWVERRFLLPLSLAEGQQDMIPLDLYPLPEAGLYYLDIEVPTMGWRFIAGRPIKIG